MKRRRPAAGVAALVGGSGEGEMKRRRPAAGVAALV